jgi:hypothetical protein
MCMQLLRYGFFPVNYSSAISRILWEQQLEDILREFGMVASTKFGVSDERGLALHRRLLEGDPTASADVAVAYLEPLISWLVARRRSGVSVDMCIEAAEDAVIALVKSPASFNPERGLGLGAYLRMSAQGDLKNLLQRENRHRQNQISLEIVELSPQAGKYLAKDDDPSLPLRIHEEIQGATAEIVSPARDGLSEGESQALDMLLQGERKTHAYALVLGLGHLPEIAQRAEVKRVKDKLKKRIQRGTARNAEAH